MKKYCPINLLIETTLLKVHSDIAEALVEGSMAALIMLDLSAAFGAFGHWILLKRFEFSSVIDKT